MEARPAYASAASWLSDATLDAVTSPLYAPVKRPCHVVDCVDQTKKKAVAPPASVARCQVDGCNAELGGFKEYHRRHKVCEPHSKAPCVVVLGADQRFCQQCSRFHVLSEFDDARRSCRRRLAGHNERRRKNSATAYAASSASTAAGLASGGIGDGGLRCLKSDSKICALSLLSPRDSTWFAMPTVSAESRNVLSGVAAESQGGCVDHLFRHLSTSANDGALIASPPMAARRQWSSHPHYRHSGRQLSCYQHPQAFNAMRSNPANVDEGWEICCYGTPP